MNRFFVVFGTVCMLALAGPVSARDTRDPYDVHLKIPPAAAAGEDAGDVPAEVQGKSIRMDVRDGRGAAGDILIGQGTNDDDLTFPIRTNDDIAGFVQALAKQSASSWGLRTDGSDGTLDIRFIRFHVDESNKAVGSMYASDVKLAYTLTSRSGRPLAEGTVSGGARRYGRARSGEDCDEVLTDAVNEALQNLLNAPDVRNAWNTRAATSAGASGSHRGPGKAAASDSKQSSGNVEQRLKKLEALHKKGVITDEEYERRRAAIVDQL